MKRRMLALFLAMIAVLSGCGQNVDENVDDQNLEQSSDSNVTEERDPGNIDPEKYEQPEMKGEITISTMVEQEFLKTAAENFEKKYPGITITINTYQGTSGENAADDYRTLLNTKIMSGKAEDIIFSTQLPVQKYMEMGVFEDLSDYVSAAPELSSENVFLNVLEAAKDEEGHLYILPYMSSFQVISFDNEVVTESGALDKESENICFSEAIDYAKQMADDSQLKNLYIMQGKNISYLEYIVKEYQQSLIDMDEKKVNINTETYTGWLQEVKAMEEEGYFNTDGSIDYYNADYHFAMVPDYDVQSAFYNVTDNLVLGAPIADEKGNVYTSSAYCIGMNSASEKKGIAWEFIKYLLSEDVQTLPSIHGLAVNKKGFEASVNRYLKFYQDGTDSIVDSEEYKSLLLKWVEGINKCDVLDPVIMDYINEENSKFFEGTQSAEKTAQILQSKITQYLNE